MIFTIAIEPDTKLVERLTFLQEDLGKIIAGRGADSRWTRPEHIHVPLLCLGTLDKGAIPETNEALNIAAKEMHAFRMTIAGISAYPTPECPRLIQAAAEPAERLTIMREKLMDRFRAANICFDGRHYEANMLLGRVATKKSRVNITDAMTAIKDLNFGQSEIFEIALYGSEHSKHGAIHKVISRFPLGAE